MKKLNKVLLVDDDEVTCFLIGITLKKAGVCSSIVVATNGSEALNLLLAIASTADCPDLIFLDLNMPVMDGFELLEELQNGHLSSLISKVVILSTAQSPKEAETAQKYAVRAHLLKPLTTKKLQALLDNPYSGSDSTKYQSEAQKIS